MYARRDCPRDDGGRGRRPAGAEWRDAYRASLEDTNGTKTLGVDPVHVGVVAVANIMLGLVTPPYGLLLFLLVKTAEVPLEDLVREVVPSLGAMATVLALITVFPDLVLYWPRLLGYTS